MNVISLYFPLWVATRFERGEVWYAIAYSISMIAVALLSPMIGSSGDRGGHLRYVVIMTGLSVLACATLGLAPSLLTALVIFGVANLGFQLAIVSYNSLLPAVAAPHERGSVSGLGVALGYLGSFIGMFAAMPFIDGSKAAALPSALEAVVRFLSVQTLASTAGAEPIRANAFLPTALLFLLFSIPLFLFVRDRRINPGKATKTATFREMLREFALALGDRNLRNYYLGTFLYMDAVHTVYIVMATYARFALGVRDDQIIKGMSIALGTAIFASWLYGRAFARIQARTMVLLVIVNWIVALLLAIFLNGFGGFVALAVVAGMGLGGVEVVGRVALLSLIPEEEAGKYFGFFSLTGKASSIAGPWIWAGALFFFESFGALRYRIGVALLLVLVLAAGMILRNVTYNRPLTPGTT